MSSACVNAAAPLPDLSSRDRSPPSYGWLRSRISTAEEQQPDDFEFRLDDPAATMLPADELFSGGRLVPLHLAPPRPAADEIRSPVATTKEEIPAGPSPRAPKCSSRWRELLGLKRQQLQSVSKPAAAAAAPATSRYPNPRSLKLFLRRDTKSAADPSQSLSLLRDSDLESVSLSSRRSLSSSSSSSSGQDHEELPRLSLDTEKPGQIPSSRHPHPHPPRVRVSRPRSATPDHRPAARSGRSPVRRPAEAVAAAPRGVSVDSPRMNASGRVVFQGLDRSSSSPGSFTGGPRVRNLAIERSYSAGVRVTPVLNVPAFGLGNLFRKERDGPPASRTIATGVAAGGGVGAKNKIERV